MSGRVRFDPPEMLAAAGKLAALSKELGTAASAARAVPTTGFPPELATRARLVLSEVGCDLGMAQTTTDRQARAIASRAARAFALNDDCTVGGGLPGALRDLRDGPLGRAWLKLWKTSSTPTAGTRRHC